MTLPPHLRDLLEAFDRYQRVKDALDVSPYIKAVRKQRLFGEMRQHKAADINRMLEFVANRCEAITPTTHHRCRRQRSDGIRHCAMHATEQDYADREVTVELTLAVDRPSLPIIECETLPDSVDHLMEPSIEQQTRAFLSWNYTTIGHRQLRQSRRYEGYAHVRR